MRFVQANRPSRLTMLAIGVAASTLGSGCGLLLQGRTSTVHINSEPSGVELRVAGRTVSSPATLELPRKPPGYVVRGSKNGFQEGCGVIPFETNRLLVALDAIPALFGVAIDRFADTWPGQLPGTVRIALNPGSDDEVEPLLPDYELLSSWEATKVDYCSAPRGVIPKKERRIATYLPMLQSVTINGKPLPGAKADQTEQRNTTSIIEDGVVRIEITSNADTIDLRLRDLTSNSIKVRWEDAVFVDFDRKSSPIGRRGFNFGPVESDAHSVIAPGTVIEKSVFPASRLYERSTPVQVTDQSCAQSCGQMVYQCMAGFNCSGYRSRQPYTGQNWAIYALIDGIDAGLCERRCVDQGQACLGTCGRVIKRSEGMSHLRIVPNLLRKCSQGQAEFERDAEKADQGTYAVLLPIEHGGARREYMLNFRAKLFEFELDEGCARASAQTND